MISCSFIRTPFVDNLVSRIHFLFFAGEHASFRFSSFFVTKRAARFRRVALKKLLSVFAEQPRAFLGTFISYHILSPKSTQFCPTLSKFVHICPSLSNLRSKRYIRRQVAISVRKLSALLKIRFFTLLIVERAALRYGLSGRFGSVASA